MNKDVIENERSVLLDFQTMWRKGKTSLTLCLKLIILIYVETKSKNQILEITKFTQQICQCCKEKREQIVNETCHVSSPYKTYFTQRKKTTENNLRKKIKQNKRESVNKARL